MIRRLLLGLVGAFSVVLFTATPGSAPSGDLDPTFDGDGKVTTDFGDGDRAEGVVIQGDGKIVVAGSAGGTNRDFDHGFDFALARYKTDGSLDPTFSGDGKVTTDFFSSDDRAFAAALQPDGKIVAAGQAFVSERDFALARYNTDGSLDATFGGGDGKVSVDLAVDETDDVALAVAIQADDKIVAAGYVRRNLFHPGYPSDFAVARFNADGSPDVNFGVGGSVTTDIESDSDEAHGLAIQADGRIVAAGPVHVPSATVDFGLARYNTNGSLDTTFDGDGKVSTGFGGSDSAEGVALQGDGKIVVAGNADLSDFALARYNTNGSLDTTFDGDGKVMSDFAGLDVATAVAIQGDGRIVAAGYVFIESADFALARYNTDGSLDASFGGGDGKVTTDFVGGGVAEGIAIGSDRRLVAVGCTSCWDASDFALARYQADVADLSIIKTGPSGRVPTGRNMTYTLTVTNDGPDEASDVVVTDTLPPSVTFVDAGFGDPLPVGYCDPPSGGVVTCYLGTIASGGSRSVLITVKPTQAGMITNSASVASPTPDPNQANNADSEDTSICRITSRRSSIPCG